MQTILILRVSMGTLLIVAGSMKFVEPREAKAAIFAFRLVPYRAVTAIYVGLISAELAAGVLLLTGFMVSIGAYVSAALFLTFGVAILSVIGRGIVAPCGCFGNSVDEKASWTTMARGVYACGRSANTSDHGGARLSWIARCRRRGHRRRSDCGHAAPGRSLSPPRGHSYGKRRLWPRRGSTGSASEACRCSQSSATLAGQDGSEQWSPFWIASFVVLWLLVICMAFLLAGAFRELGLIRLRMGDDPGALITDEGLLRGALAPDFEGIDVLTREPVRSSGAGPASSCHRVPLDWVPGVSSTCATLA